MYQTNLNPLNTLDGTKVFPTFSQPKIVGCFSVGPGREFIASGQNLKYLNLPSSSQVGGQLQLNLNEGFETRVPKPESAKQERLDHLLRFIVGNLDQLRVRSPPEECTDEVRGGRGSKVLNCDFVCFRGLLRMLMCTPYEPRTNWIVLASRYRGTIYLCAKDTDEKLQEEANQTEQQKRFCYYGFKFEQHVLSDDVNSRPSTSAPVQEAEEFCALFSSTLEGKRLLYGAEMDGIISRDRVGRSDQRPDLLNSLEFVEVKVKRRETSQRQVDNFYRFKTRNWWCQSFLVNIKKIFVGLRDDRGIVDEIREMNLKDLERDSRRFWSASVCVNFGSQFLAVVAEVLRGADCRHTVYRFEYDRNESGNIFYSVYEGQNAESFLPDWYCAVVK